LLANIVSVLSSLHLSVATRAPTHWSTAVLSWLLTALRHARILQIMSAEKKKTKIDEKKNRS